MGWAQSALNGPSIGPQSDSVENFIVLQAFPMEGFEMRRKDVPLRHVRLEARGRLDGFVPVFGPDAVGGAPALGPGEHAFVEGHVKRVAELDQHAAWVREE